MSFPKNCSPSFFSVPSAFSSLIAVLNFATTSSLPLLTIKPEPLNYIDVLKTFFLNQVKSRNEVCLGSRSQIAFCVNRQYQFCIDEKMSRRYRPDRYYAIQNMRSGTRNMIPLWLFGFLY